MHDHSRHPRPPATPWPPPSAPPSSPPASMPATAARAAPPSPTSTTCWRWPKSSPPMAPHRSPSSPPCCTTRSRTATKTPSPAPWRMWRPLSAPRSPASSPRFRTTSRCRRRSARGSQVRHAPRASDAAKQLKLADKISNLRAIAASPPKGWDHARRLEYVGWAGRVAAGAPRRQPGAGLPVRGDLPRRRAAPGSRGGMTRHRRQGILPAP